MPTDPRIPLLYRLARQRALAARTHRQLAEVSGPDVRLAHIAAAEDLEVLSERTFGAANAIRSACEEAAHA